MCLRLTSPATARTSALVSVSTLVTFHTFIDYHVTFNSQRDCPSSYAYRQPDRHALHLVRDVVVTFLLAHVETPWIMECETTHCVSKSARLGTPWNKNVRSDARCETCSRSSFVWGQKNIFSLGTSGSQTNIDTCEGSRDVQQVGYDACLEGTHGNGELDCKLWPKAEQGCTGKDNSCKHLEVVMCNIVSLHGKWRQKPWVYVIDHRFR